MESRDALATQRGSALLFALVFGVVAFLTVTVYLMGQMSLTRAGIARPQQLQARLNAASGVYRAMQIVAGDTAGDSLRTITVTDSLFNTFLFGTRTDTVHDTLAPLAIGGQPQPMELFDTLGFGDAIVGRRLAGAMVEYVSLGRFARMRAGVIATVAGTWPLAPESLMIIGKRTSEPVSKTVKRSREAAKRAGGITVDETILDEIRLAHRRAFEMAALGLPDMPKAVMDDGDLAGLPDTVRASLLFDGSFGELRWRTRRTIVVTEDLQFTGKVFVEGARFVVGGEVKVFDDARLESVGVVAGGRVLISQNARFSGDVLSFKSIYVGERAQVLGRSSLCVAPKGTPARRDSSKAGAKASEDTSWAVSLVGDARVDASVVALGAESDVRIGDRTILQGPVYTEGYVCVGAVMKGSVVTARGLRACDPGGLDSASMKAAVRRLSELDSYRLPAFAGTQSVVSWDEQSLDDIEPASAEEGAGDEPTEW